jgi:hypothetical protein
VTEPAVVTDLRAHAPAIARDATAAMYENPFWDERFGERGRKRAAEDAAYHVEYLAQSLAAGDASIMRGYARWLQPLLTSRGMCTRHIDESFARIGAAVAARVPHATAAEEHVAAARDALVYAEGVPHELTRAAPDLARAATDALHERHPEWIERWGQRGRERCLDDVAYHLSYAGDALALGRAEVFTDYVRFIDGFLARRGFGGDHLRDTLDVLAEIVAREARRSPELARQVGELLGGARGAI